MKKNNPNDTFVLGPIGVHVDRGIDRVWGAAAIERVLRICDHRSVTTVKERKSPVIVF